MGFRRLAIAKNNSSSVVTRYLEKSMFDGFAEITESNPCVLKLFWIILVVIGCIACVGLLVRTFVDYARQPLLQRMYVAPLETKFPDMHICIERLVFKSARL